MLKLKTTVIMGFDFCNLVSDYWRVEELLILKQVNLNSSNCFLDFLVDHSVNHKTVRNYRTMLGVKSVYGFKFCVFLLRNRFYPLVFLK